MASYEIVEFCRNEPPGDNNASTGSIAENGQKTLSTDALSSAKVGKIGGRYWVNRLTRQQIAHAPDTFDKRRRARIIAEFLSYI